MVCSVVEGTLLARLPTGERDLPHVTHGGLKLACK